MSSGKVYIYALKDPRDGQIRYVGKTANVSRRLKGHIRDGIISRKRAWLIDLVASGLIPEVEILEIANTENFSQREAAWIEKVANEGCNITNVVFNPNGKESIEQDREVQQRYFTDEQEQYLKVFLTEMKRLLHIGAVNIAGAQGDMNEKSIGWRDATKGCAFLLSPKFTKIIKSQSPYPLENLTSNAIHSYLDNMQAIERREKDKTSIVQRVNGKVCRVLCVTPEFVESLYRMTSASFSVSENFFFKRSG